MTAPQPTLESPDGLAGQSLGAARGSARLSAKTLASILVRHGIIDPCAIEDAEGYDGGTAALRIINAAQEISEAVAPNAELSDSRPL